MERVQDTAHRGPTKRCSTMAVAASSFIPARRDVRNRCIKRVVPRSVWYKRWLAATTLDFVTTCDLQQYFNRCLSQQKPEGCCTKSGSSVAQAAQRKIRRAPVVGLGSVEGKMWPAASFPRYADATRVTPRFMDLTDFCIQQILEKLQWPELWISQVCHC